MVIALEYLAKTSFAEAIRYFEAVGDVLALLGYVFVFVVVKSMIVDSIRGRRWALLANSFLYVQPIDHIVF